MYEQQQQQQKPEHITFQKHIILQLNKTKSSNEFKRQKSTHFYVCTYFYVFLTEGFLPLVSVMLAAIGYQAGLGPIPWSYTGDFFSWRSIL